MSRVLVFRRSRSNPVSLPAPVAIHDAPRREGPPAAPAPACPPGPFALLFTRTVADAPMEVLSVLAAGDRIYAMGSMVWTLLHAATGEVVARGLRGLGDGALDPLLPLLYQPDAQGQLDGLHFDAGQRVFWSPLYLNANLLRTFLARVGDSLLLLGSERSRPASGSFEPKLSCLEALTVGPVPEVRPSGQLAPGMTSPLLWQALGWTAAAWAQGLAIAFPGEIHRVDESLDIVRVLTFHGEPVALSVDAAGVLHLIVDAPGEPRALWIVAWDGQRSLRLPLPAPYDRTQQPPLLLPTGQVLVRAPAGLLCLGQGGEIHWTGCLAPDGGAVALADGSVLATDGHDLVRFAADGARTIVHQFPDHLLRGPPLVSDGGEITLATRTEILRLRPCPAHPVP
ncbi:hypothetical protein [Nannocystis sp.]|uniref:hypothetical protein n=1 Tax=Nannocystis sp. TaxID=1962667 RepID=UPI0025F888EF|nr:hypothetical protein [Nannocystis sp.]MBK7827405.1 hypothetical protein [Nannocystis sp.]